MIAHLCSTSISVLVLFFLIEPISIYWEYINGDCVVYVANNGKFCGGESPLCDRGIMELSHARGRPLLPH